jgi:hypothetical protein
VKLGKKRREISKRKYYIISRRVIIKAIIIIKHSQISKKSSIGIAQWPEPEKESDGEIV